MRKAPTSSGQIKCTGDTGKAEAHSKVNQNETNFESYKR